ncbi:MAG: Yip1 family protein, partial [Halobacteriota archaeon]|nr:Yip1 family protein [Halobacteriota archaeon]
PKYMNAELERKRLLNEVAPLVRSGSAKDAEKKIKEAGKLSEELEKHKETKEPEYNNEFSFGELSSNFYKGNEIVVRKDVPVVTLSEKIVSAAILPNKEIEYITEHPFIEDAILIVGLSAILVAISDIFSNQINSYPEVAMTILYVYVLWVSISAVAHMISSAFGGEGELYPQMTTIVGYSMIPLSIGHALEMVLPYSMNEVIYLTLIWSGVILSYGVKRSRNLPIGKSMISACALLLWLIMLV